MSDAVFDLILTNNYLILGVPLIIDVYSQGSSSLGYQNHAAIRMQPNFIREFGDPMENTGSYFELFLVRY